MITKRLRIILAILIAAIVGGVAWQVLRPREPVYRGRPLSFWLEGYLPYGNARPEPATVTTANMAMLHAGTNAIPTLLRLLQANDPPWKLKLFALLTKQRVIKFNHVPAEERHFQGMRGFFFLGPKAGDAVPALMTIFERNISYSSRESTLIALGRIGSPAKIAIPMLINAMTNTDMILRAYLINTLDHIHAAPELVVPVLCNSLNDPNSTIRLTVIGALGNLEADAKPAVPALIKLLKDQDSDVRAAATNLLKQIDPEAAAKAGVE